MHVSTLVGATRPAFLSVTLVGILLGLSSAYADGHFRSIVLAVLTLLFALVAHAGANVVNDYYDALSGCDAANTERIFPFTGGSRFIQDGRLSTRQTALLAYGLLASVIPAGLYLAYASGPDLLLIGLCGFIAAWAYSAPPLKLQSRSLGELTITLAWMTVVLGADYVQRGELALTPTITGLAYALLVANVLFINQIPDRVADAACGKKTLIVRFGLPCAPLGCGLLYLLAAVIIGIGIWCQALPLMALSSLVVGISAIYSVAQLQRSSADEATLRRIIPLTIASTLLFGLLLCLSLLLS